MPKIEARPESHSSWCPVGSQSPTDRHKSLWNSELQIRQIFGEFTLASEASPTASLESLVRPVIGLRCFRCGQNFTTKPIDKPIEIVDSSRRDR